MGPIRSYAAVIAAAGQSRRLRQPKALMPIGCESAVSHLAKVFFRAGLADVFVTLPAQVKLNDRNHVLLRSLSAQSLTNLYESAGYIGSVITVLQRLDPKVAGLFVTPVDAPLLDARLVETMASAATYSAGSPAIIVPHFNHRAGHPVFLSRFFFDALINFSGTGGLRSFIASQKKYVRRLYWSDARILFNLNHLGDWQIIVADNQDLL